MSFHQVLRRLRSAVSEGPRGPGDQVLVFRRDLVELLRDFDRIDAELRARLWDQDVTPKPKALPAPDKEG